MQKPDELADFLQWLVDVEAQSILEIGCAYGGSLWAYRQLGLDTFGIDLPTYPENYIRSAARACGARMQIGSSQDGTVIACAPNVDVVFIDGDHTFKGVSLDFLNYHHRASIGVAFHDINRHYQQECEVDRMWNSLKARGDMNLREILYPPVTWGGIGIWQLR